MLEIKEDSRFESSVVLSLEFELLTRQMAR